MANVPKDVTLKGLVDSVFADVIASYEGKKIDFEKAWPSIWEQLVDEAEEFGIIVLDTSVPKYPPMLKGKSADKNVREQLLIILEGRLK